MISGGGDRGRGWNNDMSHPIIGFAGAAITGSFLAVVAWFPEVVSSATPHVDAVPSEWIEPGAVAAFVGCLLYAVTTLWKTNVKLGNEIRGALYDGMKGVSESNARLTQALDNAVKKLPDRIAEAFPECPNATGETSRGPGDPE